MFRRVVTKEEAEVMRISEIRERRSGRQCQRLADQIELCVANLVKQPSFLQKKREQIKLSEYFFFFSP